MGNVVMILPKNQRNPCPSVVTLQHVIDDPAFKIYGLGKPGVS
jgi:hypothetical protein